MTAIVVFWLKTMQAHSQAECSGSSFKQKPLSSSTSLVNQQQTVPHVPSVESQGKHQHNVATYPIKAVPFDVLLSAVDSDSNCRLTSKTHQFFEFYSSCNKVNTLHKFKYFLFLTVFIHVTVLQCSSS